MTAEQLLDELANKDLVPVEVIDKLRRQVAASKKPVSVAQIVELLESKGYLTTSQATRLRQESQTSRSTSDRKKPAPRQDDDDDDLFELVPIDEPPVAESKPPVPRVAPLAPSSEVKPPNEVTSAAEGRSGAADETETEAISDLLADTMADVPETDQWEQGTVGSRRGLARWLRFGRRRSAGARRQPDNPWDSPLLLIGGGALILLILGGATLLYLINRGSGDKLLKMAEDAYREESYTQAIDKYNRFLDRYPRHASVSLAKVHRGLAQLRQTLQSTRDGGQQLTTAKAVLDEIEGEDEFAEARAELAAILPEIADRLAQQAREGGSASETRQQVDLAEDALALVMNTNYVPTSLRPNQRVKQTRETLDLVLRDLTQVDALATAIEEIESAIASGDTRQAYAIRAGLLKTYPSLATDQTLADMVLKITAAEQANVQVVRQTIAAVRDDPLPSTVGLVARRGPAPGSQPGTPALVIVDGVVSALDAATGQLLWRRSVGVDLRGVTATGPDGTTALLVDTARRELVCVALASGQLKWRFPVGERFAPPCVMPDRILIAAASGKLYVLDPATGESTEHAVIPQRLTIAPVFAPQQQVIYQLGEHSSLYVLSAADLQCRQVFYLGHAKGSIAVAPVVGLRRLVVAENRGVAAATLHVLSPSQGGPASDASNAASGNDDGAEVAEPVTAKEPGLTIVKTIRLTGHVLTPPVVDGRLLAVATDRGQVKLFEVDSGDAVTPVAERAPDGKQPRIRYPLLHNGLLWVAGTKLTKYQIQPQAGQLTPQGIERTYRGDVFDNPLQRVDQQLISVRRRAGHDGATVAATVVTSGQQTWESRIGMRPASAPQVDVAQGTVAVITTDGMFFRLDRAAFQRGIAAPPQAPSTSPDEIVALTERIDLGGQRTAFASAEGNRNLLVCDLGEEQASEPLKWLRLVDDPACTPAAFGTGLLVPTRQGQVRWLDPRTGDPLAEPFQPPLKQASMPAWQPPCAVKPDSREFIIADGLGQIYRVGIEDQPTRHLVALAKTGELAESINTPPVVLADTVLAGTAAGRLLAFILPQLKPAATIELGGLVRWGPHGVGNSVLLTTEADDLLCIDSRREILWRVKLPYGPLAGMPWAADQRIVLAASGGTVWQVDATTGKELSRVDAGEPLASGPVPIGQKWLVAAASGAVITVALPGPE